MRALFSEFARLEPNTSSHVSHHCTLDLPDWREGTRVSPSRLPVFLQPCPGSPEPLLAVIASGLGTPHGSRKQQSHFTSWYTVAHSGVDDACFTPRRARIFHKAELMIRFFGMGPTLPRDRHEGGNFASQMVVIWFMRHQPCTMAHQTK